MAQMKRNVNLEEIDSDALFGISALKNQTVNTNSSSHFCSFTCQFLKIIIELKCSKNITYSL